MAPSRLFPGQRSVGTEDISVVGFDVYDPTGLLVPGITTIRSQMGSWAKTAAKLM